MTKTPNVNKRYLLYLGLLLLLVFSDARAQVYSLDKNDQRKLYFDLAGQEQTLTIQQLLAMVPPEIIDIYDIDFKAQRKYWAIDLVKLLNELGQTQETLEAFKELSFVCDDGYTVNSEVPLLFSKKAKPYLAIASASKEIARSMLINGRWEAYQQGSNTIGFDPFYLVWSSASSDFNTSAKDYPWPYQLAKIKVSKVSDYLAIRPPVSSGATLTAKDTELNQGFDVFTTHCIRCHQIKGFGGSLGPNILRPNGMLDVMSDELLAQLITNVNSFYPVTAMPNFSDTINEAQALNIVAYLRLMKAQSSH